MFISNNSSLFHLWRKENLVKHQKVSKYYENDFSKNFNLKWNHVLAINFTESCRAGGKWACERYLQKSLPIFAFSIRFITVCCKDFKRL